MSYCVKDSKPLCLEPRSQDLLRRKCVCVRECVLASSLVSLLFLCISVTVLTRCFRKSVSEVHITAYSSFYLSIKFLSKQMLQETQQKGF